MIRKSLLSLLLVVWVQSARAETPALSVTGKIDSVIVFSDRAVVRRVQALPADKGSGVVRFHSLPVALVRDSVRAAGKEVTITGVAVRATTPTSEREWLSDPLRLAIDELDLKLSAERDRLATYNEQLRLLGNLGGLYSINPSTAVATKKAQISVALAGTAFGIDFNPTVDRLRVVSNTGQNLRVNVDTGAALVDGGLVSGGTTATGVAAVAYTNVDSDPATATTLFDIDVNSDQLLVQNPPNDGVLVGIGAPLGIDATGPVGFDLYSSVKDIGGGVITTTDLAGYATVATAAGRSLYQVTPFSGRLVNLGALGLPVRDIAIPLAQ